MSRDPYQIILEPILTEKLNAQKEGSNRVAFRVALDATKPEIRRAVQTMYGEKNKIKATKIHTMIVKGKVKRFGRTMDKRPDIKKAIISLTGEGKIDFFEAT